MRSPPNVLVQWQSGLTDSLEYWRYSRCVRCEQAQTCSRRVRLADSERRRRCDRQLCGTDLDPSRQDLYSMTPPDAAVSSFSLGSCQSSCQAPVFDILQQKKWMTGGCWTFRSERQPQYLRLYFCFLYCVPVLVRYLEDVTFLSRCKQSWIL